MTLTRYGRREWLTITVVALVLASGALIIGWWWLAIPVAIVWAAGAAFFRDPHREIPTGLAPGIMLSPADGTISAVEHLDEHPATGGPAVLVRIFLSVLNVHVNRAPCDCSVVGIQHSPGKYLNAQTPESAHENESNLMTLRFEGDGMSRAETFGVKQIAGMIARRIVCAVEVGDRLARAEKFGMIKFGSTTELILPRPDDVTVHVTVGEKVRGGLTMLATIAPRGAEIVTTDAAAGAVASDPSA